MTTRTIESNTAENERLVCIGKKSLTGFRLLALVVIYCSMASLSPAGDTPALKKFEGAALIVSRANDGDSFRVDLGDRQVSLRLYFADCLETSVATETDARRVRTQTRYFGLKSHRETVFYGKEAARFTAAQLANPFTVHTSFATAPGRSAGGRHYGFVTTSSGSDLAELLVANGYARAFGVARRSPAGIGRDETAEMLRDTESAAMLARRGIWSASDPDTLVTLRAKEREEQSEIEAIKEQVRPVIGQVNINTASAEDLQTLPGIGPKTAERVISGRPYKSVDELLRVKGIGNTVLRKMLPHLESVKQKP